MAAGVFQSLPGNGFRLLIGGAGEELRADFSGQLAQLFNSGRPVYVATHHQRFFMLAFLQPASQLGDTGRFTGALQPGHQHHGWRLHPQIQLGIGLAHDPNQFIINDLDQHLAGRQARHHLLSYSAFPHLFDQVAHH